MECLSLVLILLLFGIASLEGEEDSRELADTVEMASLFYPPVYMPSTPCFL